MLPLGIIQMIVYSFVMVVVSGDPVPRLQENVYVSFLLAEVSGSPGVQKPQSLVYSVTTPLNPLGLDKRASDVVYFLCGAESASG